ncbi:oocyte zinc finger protein XlCOF8.4-like [Ranitomeya imitator]|uniref:oocyte zinc finger protein XlCOF8.4-like n=1 Tax=Ranitomeya imitator TaxID=111125 RepID=UPI0037E96097
MDMDNNKMEKRLLQLTIEILFRLTGQDYTVMKKTSSKRGQDPVSEEWGRPLRPDTGHLPHHQMHEDINDQKILELIYMMIQLLTGEVPLRCQDVAVYFSMEEWEYLEGHKDLYKDIMMEVPQPLTSPVLSSKRTTPERCPRPLLPQDCKQEDPNVPQDPQGEDVTHINTTETYARGDEWCKEEIPTYDYPDKENKAARMTQPITWPEPIEHLWKELMLRVHRSTRDLQDLKNVYVEEWVIITPEQCMQLVSPYGGILKLPSPAKAFVQVFIKFQ